MLKKVKMTYSLNEIPTLEPANFIAWKLKIIETFKQLNAWYLIDGMIPLDLIEKTGDEKQIKNYQDLSLKVEYLLRRSLSKEDNKLVRENTEDIYTAWYKLIEKYETVEEKLENLANSKEMSVKKLQYLIKEGSVDADSVDDYMKKKVKKLAKKYLKKYAKNEIKEEFKIDDLSSDDEDNLIQNDYIKLDGDNAVSMEKKITTAELLSCIKILTKTFNKLPDTSLAIEAKKLSMFKLEQALEALEFS